MDDICFAYGGTDIISFLRSKYIISHSDISFIIAPPLLLCYNTQRGGDFMKMWKSKSWQLEVTGVDGNVQLFGVNIFDYDWVDTKNRVEVNDLSYAVPVYTVIIDGEKYEFAAGERSNCVWNFYLNKY